MSNEIDRVEAALRARRVSPVADEGFAERMLVRLPPRRASAGRWAIPAFSLLGALLAMPGLGGARDIPAWWQSLGVTALLVLAGTATLLVWATCAWALLSDRHRPI
jgi:hypothetical protein